MLLWGNIIGNIPVDIKNMDLHYWPKVACNEHYDKQV